MVQVSERVGVAMKGSMKAVAGSGMANMSLASIDFQPRIEEPSKPRPSLKESSDSSLIGKVKCCQVPKVSTNFTSTILAPCFRASSNTCLGELILLCFFLVSMGCLNASLRQSRFRSANRHSGRDLVLWLIDLNLCAVITLFAVLSEIETDGFDFLIRAETDQRLHDECDDDCAEDSDDQRHADGFELGNPLGVVGNGLGEAILCRVIGQVHFIADIGEVTRGIRVNIRVRKHAREERADGSADGVDAERVERVVVAEPGLDLVAEEPGDQASGDADDHGAR